MRWAEAARGTLEARFWNAERGMLLDVVDDGHVPGDAHERFLKPLHAHLARAGVGHVSEIVDAGAPF